MHDGNNGAAVLADTLLENGISHVFGLPGDTSVELYTALSARSDVLTHVVARDERHAAYMADAYARASGRIAAVEVSSGGGAAYVVGGIAEAFAASIPVLVIVSDVDCRSRGSGALTEMDQPRLFGAVSKLHMTVERVRDIPASVRRAMTVAVSGRPGPVVLTFPENVFGESDDGRDAAVSGRGDATGSVDMDGPNDDPPRKDAPPREEIVAAVTMITEARRAVMIAGGGVHRSGAWDTVAAAATRFGLPVATTIHGKGAIATGHPLSLGVTGNNGGHPAVIEYIKGADVVVLVGTRANATDTDSFTAPPPSAATIVINADPSFPAHNYPGSLVLRGDAGAVLTALLRAAEELGVAARHTDLSPVRRAIGQDVGGATATDSADGDVLSTRRVIESVQLALHGRKHVVIADPGTPTPYIAHYWEVEKAGRQVIIPRGNGPMGYAIPASVGVSAAAPDATVVAITADGSFAMACGELETVRRLNKPIVFVQLSNGGFGWIKMLQHLYEGRRYFGVDVGGLDPAKVADGAGICAIHATSYEQVQAGVEWSVVHRQPIYIDVRVRPLEVEVPVVSSWLRALDGDAKRPVY